MLIDGEKWACEACVRGHRVSSCHHSDRPLTHINKKGRPVSQCAHCRGLRKSRTTHVKCECGDKKKNSHKNDSDLHAVEKRDLKQDSRPRCGCTHGQRCTCALKKDPQLDTVPEVGVPPPPHAASSEPPKKPQLTSTKSDGALTIFRDGHHKPAHKHNDMAHKCGLPYTIPRSHTIHTTADVARRSYEFLPLTEPSFLEKAFAIQTRPEPSSNRPQPHAMQSRLSKSEHGTPENAPVTTTEDMIATISPLDLSPFFPPPPANLDQSHGTRSDSMALPRTSMEPLDSIVTSMPPLDVSFSSYPAATTTSATTTAATASPVAGMAFQDPYQEPFFASPESEQAVSSATFSAPPVDWSNFPLYSSDVAAATSTQAPSYASFDYNSMAPGFPAPSSSGDISEVEDFGPLTGLGPAGNDLHDLHSVSENSDLDQYRISSASSFIGLPQAQLLSSNNLEAIDIDEFLKSANESTAALEHQLQASMGMEPKALPAPNTFEAMSTPTSLPMTTTSPAESMWPVTMFDPNGPSLDENSGNFYAPPWV